MAFDTSEGVVQAQRVLVGDENGQHVEVVLDDLGRPVIRLFTGSPEEASPAVIKTSPSGTAPALSITGPRNVNAPVGSITPEIDFTSWDSSASTMNLWADEILPNVPLQRETTWTSLNRINSWADVAGARAGYYQDAAGIVHIRGQVVSGTSAVIANGLPAPTQSQEFTTHIAGSATLCAVMVTTGGLLQVTVNAASAQASGCRIDMSYPTL